MTAEFALSSIFGRVGCQSSRDTRTNYYFESVSITRTSLLLVVLLLFVRVSLPYTSFRSSYLYHNSSTARSRDQESCTPCFSTDPQYSSSWLSTCSTVSPAVLLPAINVRWINVYSVRLSQFDHDSQTFTCGPPSSKKKGLSAPSLVNQTKLWVELNI